MANVGFGKYYTRSKKYLVATLLSKNIYTDVLNIVGNAVIRIPKYDWIQGHSESFPNHLYRMLAIFNFQAKLLIISRSVFLTLVYNGDILVYRSLGKMHLELSFDQTLL